MLKSLVVSPSPHISKPLSTRTVMIDVAVALLPAVTAAWYFFRVRAAILVAACVAASVLTELLCNLIRRKPRPMESLADFSAVVTGIILALSLPPALPAWAAVIGSAFAIAIGKMVFGGLGSNIFNPAMAGRAFLMASFGMLMTTWTVPATLNPQMPQIGPDTGLDAVSRQTPLAHSKDAIKNKTGAATVNRQLAAMFEGRTGGCLGETSSLAILLGALYLLIRRTISWQIPAGMLASAFVFAGIAHLVNPDAYVSPLVHLTAGGLLLGAFFIATDPVTAPLTTKGMWIFGIGIGTLTMLIRIVGEYPEGVMFAVLLMNATTPLIDRFCRLVPAGGKPGE